MNNTMETKELNLNQMEKISGGVDRESNASGGGDLIGWLIDLIFGD